MIIERPEKEEFAGLVREYGVPKLKQKEIHFNFDYEDDYPECKGEAVLEILNEEGLRVGVKHREGTIYVLPQGRVMTSEPFIDGAKREALEETGFDVEILTLKEVRTVDIQFTNELLNRWYFLFECVISGGSPEPEDKDEIGSVDFFEEVPWKMDLY
ncbi:MAG: NUDIX hydrolase [Thermoplasmatota archaeon]